jgi:hypothetical protein
MLQLCLAGHKVNFTLRSKLAGVDGKIILKRIVQKQEGGADWIDLAQDTDKWWAHVNGVMRLWVA